MILKINLKILIFLVIILIITMCYLSHTFNVKKVSKEAYISRTIIQTHSRAIKSNTKTDQTTSKTVLFWTNYFSQKRWYLPADSITLQCPLAECIFTINRTLLSSLDMYDAVVFHTARHFNTIPNVRGEQQLYVMAQLESPLQTMHSFNNERDFYNLTMTYRFDADIHWNYNTILDRKTNDIVAPSLLPHWRNIDTEWTQTDRKLLDMTNRKNKVAAWFVSRCNAVSKREQLVVKLRQNYIEVDIYGGCGKLNFLSHTINVSKVYSSLNIDYNPNQKKNLITTVLFWTAFFEDKRWMLPVDTISLQCPLAECIFTNNRTLLPSLDMYDAVVFHTARPFHSIPNVRGAQQLYVMAQLESPEHTSHKFNNENKFYNLTMAYRLDSDIVWSYNNIFDRETNAIVAPSFIQQWRNVNTNWTQTDQQLLAMINAKNKLVAWPVSNCKSASNRENLVKKLQNHIKVDIFGQCGEMKCARHNSECDDLLDNSYKFYLSFENSLCIDYVTEKLFDALQRNVVPIVYGGANYSYFAPPHSYIDAQSFPNVSALADYIKYLDNTPLEYVKYFWWKRYYKVPVRFEPLVPYCDLCHRINSKSIQERTQIYRDMNSYWHSGTCTRKSKIDF